MDITKYKSSMVNIGLCLFSIAVTLVVLEILIRIFAPGAHQHQQRTVYHPQAGYQLQKNLDIEVDAGNGPIHLITNEYGYVGKSFPLEKPDDEFRIANFGDSYVEGTQMVDWNKTFVYLIGENLNTEIERPFYVRSINFGIGGRGTIEEFWTYKYVAQEFQPDLNILWFTESNDFANNYLPIADYASLAENKMGNIKYILKKSALVSFLFEYLKDNIRFISVLHYLGLSNKVAYTGNANIQNDGMHFDDKVNYSTKPEMAEIQEHAYRVTEELLLDFKELTRQNGEEFLVVIIPGFYDLADCLFEELYPDVSREDYDMNKARGHLIDILKRNDINFFNLAYPIELYNAQELDIEYCGNLAKDHFTPCGHRVTAEIVSEYILKHYIH